MKKWKTSLLFPRSLPRALALIAFAIPFVISSSCGVPTDPLKSLTNSTDLPSIGGSSLVVDITDQLGVRNYLVSEKETLVSGQNYNFILRDTSVDSSANLNKVNSLAQNEITWSLTSTPSGVCSLSTPSGADAATRAVNCSTTAKVELKFEIATGGDKQSGSIKRAFSAQENILPSGKILYQQNCLSCHGAIGTSLIKGVTPQQIAKAIVENPWMNTPKFNSLQAIQIRSIAIALNEGALPPPPAPVYDGPQIYAQNCAACHGPLATSTKAGKTAAEITTALQGIPYMQLPTLQALSANEVSAVASALFGVVPTPTPPTPPADPTPTPDPDPVPPTPPGPPDGIQLYASNCVSCHGALASSTKQNKTSAQITNAIQTISYMSSLNSLKALTSAEISAIASALVVTAPPPPSTPTPVYDGSVLYGNNCALCHGPLAMSTKQRKSAATISLAIQNQSYMKTLSNLQGLTSGEVEAIATALNIPLPTTPDPTPQPPIPTPDPTPTLSPGDAVRGTTLYGNNCASCHGTLNNSQKKGRDFATIKSATLTVGMMSSNPAIQGLSDQDLTDIVSALGVAAPVTPITPDFSYLSGTFSLFISPSGVGTDDNLVISYIKNYITIKSEFVGGIYSIYALDSSIVNKSGTTTETKFSASANPPASSIRRGYINRFCEETLSRSVPMTNFLKVKQLTTTSAFTDQNIKSVFNLFLPGRTPTPEIIQALKAVGTNAQTLTGYPADGWRYIIYSLCISSAADLQ